MSIIKFEISIPEAVTALAKFRENRFRALELLSEEIKGSVTTAINDLLQAELSLFLGQPEQEGNKKNGYKEKTYTFKGIGTLSLRIPQDRNAAFESSVVPKSERIDPRLKGDMALLHLAGISNRTLAMISKRILGLAVSKDTISDSMGLISEGASKWLNRRLEDKYWALYIDGTNFNVQRRGSTEKEPSLVVLGVSEDDHRSVLAIEPGYKDSAESWRELFKSLKKRGLDPFAVRIGIMDGLPGLEKVFKEEFPNAVTARCWVHALRNALAKCPKRIKEAFEQASHKVMYATSKNDAAAQFELLKAQMGPDARRAVDCIEKDLESLLAHYTFEKSYWRALKTTNPIERINKEFKRRTKSMETIGEETLSNLLAFTALRLEMGWTMYTVNDKRHERLDRAVNTFEEVASQMMN